MGWIGLDCWHQRRKIKNSDLLRPPALSPAVSTSSSSRNKRKKLQSPERDQLFLRGFLVLEKMCAFAAMPRVVNAKVAAFQRLAAHYRNYLVRWR